jgi:acetyl esterase/lipase
LFRAPTNFFWYVAIVVSEFSWIGLSVLLVVCLFLQLPEGWKIAGWTLTTLAAILYLYPIAAAYAISSDLDNRIDEAFAPAGGAIHSKHSATTVGQAQSQTHLSDSDSPLSLPLSLSDSPLSLSLSPAYAFQRTFTGIFDTQIVPRTVEYDSAARLNFDLYTAQGDNMKPCILVVHGGSWAGGSNEQIPELNSRLARLGYAVVAINYRLAPEHHYPAPVEDVQRALAYLDKHANELHVDVSRVVLLGRSAGAQIALAAAYQFPPSGVKGVISFYGPADMVWGYSAPANPLVLDSKKVMEDYLGGTYNQVPDNYKRSSPIEWVTSTSVPTLLIHGKRDALVAYEHTTRLDRKLRAAGVKHFVLSLPWATHGCDYTQHGPSGQLSFHAIQRFLKLVL